MDSFEEFVFEMGRTIAELRAEVRALRRRIASLETEARTARQPAQRMAHASTPIGIKRRRP